MAYANQFASNANHCAFVEDQGINESLSLMNVNRQPYADDMLQRYFNAPKYRDITCLPEHIRCIDGGIYVSPEAGVSTLGSVAYTRIVSVGIDAKEYRDIGNSPTIDPERLANMGSDFKSYNYILPVGATTIGESNSPSDSFRAQTHAILSDPRYRYRHGDSDTGLMGTVARLSHMRTGDMGEYRPGKVCIQCPTCRHSPVLVRWDQPSDICDHCGAIVYGADVLNLWEEVSNYMNDAQPAKRFMNTIERIVLVHDLRETVDKCPDQLGTTCFISDGPLAIFGPAHWLNGPLLNFVHQIYSLSEDICGRRPLILGIQKGGDLVEHARSVLPILPVGSVMALYDDYRRRYVKGDHYIPERGFGYGSYYGGDFIYISELGELYVFSLPFPFTREKVGDHFGTFNAMATAYQELPRATQFIDAYRCDMFEGALVPIVLANDLASIGESGSGKVLDALTNKALSEGSGGLSIIGTDKFDEEVGDGVQGILC